MSADPRIRELLPDYVLGLLEPSEAARVERAVQRSAPLRAEAEALRAALYVVPEALEPEPQTPEAWETLLARVRSEPAVPAASEDPHAAATRAPAPPRAPTGAAGSARPQRGSPGLAVALAIALALLAGTAGWGALEHRRASLSAHEEAVVAYWMRYPGLRIVSLDPVGDAHAGVVCVLPDGRAMALQPHAPSAGRSYVLYGVSGGD
ncbi:MAG: hypothetical protein P8Y02_11765, partial [Deinococcales bacterium]